MDAVALALVTCAAFLHAGWNLLTKRATSAFAFLWSAMTLAALWLLPFAVATSTWDELAPALPATLMSGVVHAAYFVVLPRAYAVGDLGLVYPVARGLGVGLVPILAFVIRGERPSAVGAAGLAIVVAGIVVSSATTRANADKKTRGLGLAIATGLLIATYSLFDATAARKGPPIAVVVTMSLVANALLLPLVYRRRAEFRAEWRTAKGWILVASTMCLSGYCLVLFAYQRAKTGYVVAARELGIVVTALVGVTVLGEPRSPARLAGAFVILLGVVLVAFAR